MSPSISGRVVTTDSGEGVGDFVSLRAASEPSREISDEKRSDLRRFGRSEADRVASSSTGVKEPGGPGECDDMEEVRRARSWRSGRSCLSMLVTIPAARDETSMLLSPRRKVAISDAPPCSALRECPSSNDLPRVRGMLPWNDRGRAEGVPAMGPGRGRGGVKCCALTGRGFFGKEFGVAERWALTTSRSTRGGRDAKADAERGRTASTWGLGAELIAAAGGVALLFIVSADADPSVVSSCQKLATSFTLRCLGGGSH